ncbi:hypothetical protein [Kibdelosporangium aridum]
MPDTQHPSVSRVRKLVRDAAEAADVRAFQTDPDVVALRVERVRAQVDRLCWTGIVLGLAFTMTNVQHFAAAGSPAWSLPWLAAWLLDPTVSVVLLAILRAEQVTARYQVRTGPWVRRAKWFTLAATYVMNTWVSYAAGSVTGIVLHSVPPLVVFVAAEAVTDLRDKLTEAVHAAATETAARRTQVQATFMRDTAATAANASVHEPTTPTQPVKARRTSFGEYLDRARAAWSPGVAITPAWVREVTGCSRGLSSRLASTLSTEKTGDGETAVNGGETHAGGRS